MFLERVSKISGLKRGMCPNKCGLLTLLKRRQGIIYLIPVELIEQIDNPSEGVCGYLAGVCPECGFILVTDDKECREGMICKKCGEEMEWTLWNTEKGDASGWHCTKCDVYHPQTPFRRSPPREAEDP